MLSKDRSKSVNTISWLLHASGLFIVLIISLAMSFGLNIFVNCNNTELADRAAKMQTLLDNKDRLQSEQSQLTASLEKIRRRVASSQKRLPDDAQEEVFLSALTQAADQEGLEIVDYQRLDVAVMETHHQLKVQLTGEGQYRSICGFLDHLRMHPRAMFVEMLSVDTGVNEPDYRMNLTVLLLYTPNRTDSNDWNGTHG